MKNQMFSGNTESILKRIPSNTATLIYVDSLDPSCCQCDQQVNEDFAWKFVGYAKHFRRILSENGSVYLHIPGGSTIDYPLIFKQVFENPPLHEITWPININTNAFDIPRTNHDRILVFAKSDNFIFHQVRLQLNEENIKRYSCEDQKGRYRRVTLISPLRYIKSFEWRGFTPPNDRSWRYKKEKLDTLLADGMIHLPDNGSMPSLKQYFDDHPGIPVASTWDDIPSIILGAERQQVQYIAQKPLKLLDRIIQQSTNIGDVVLDPFVGTGTTLVAAEKLNRNWIGIDSHPESIHITQKRLATEMNDVDYDFMSKEEWIKFQKYSIDDNAIAFSVQNIIDIQEKLTDFQVKFSKIKALVGSNDDDDIISDLEELIEKIVSDSLVKKQISTYCDLIKEWLTDWNSLDTLSKTFLPSAEFFLTQLQNTENPEAQDYSPVVIQYCRALENEILKKIFTKYHKNIGSRKVEINNFMAADEKLNKKMTDKLSLFQRHIKEEDPLYTFGEMSFIMQLIQAKPKRGKTLKNSILLQDFSNFTLSYFDEHLLEKTFLDKLKNICSNYRNKSAHPNILNLRTAIECQQLVQESLVQFLSARQQKMDEFDGVDSPLDLDGDDVLCGFHAPSKMRP